jgi:hypothetical protein
LLPRSDIEAKIAETQNATEKYERRCKDPLRSLKIPTDESKLIVCGRVAALMSQNSKLPADNPEHPPRLAPFKVVRWKEELPRSEHPKSNPFNSDPEKIHEKNLEPSGVRSSSSVMA